MTIVVTGATGTVGSEVVRGLIGAGPPVRAAVTAPHRARFDPAVEVVRFDFRDASTFEAAFGGARALFLVRPPKLANARRDINPAVDAAIAAGVERIVFLSVQGADRNVILPHHAIEQHLRQTGVNATSLRAAFFMQNLLTVHARDIRDRGQIVLPAGHGRTAFIDARDIAAVAVRTLTGTGTGWRAHELTGSEALTYDDVAATFRQVLGKRVVYTDPSPWRFWRHMRAQGEAPVFILLMIGLYSVARFGLAGHLTPDTRQILGRAPIRLDRFILDNARVWL